MFVTIASFSNSYEANIVAARLESEGIVSVITNEHTIQGYMSPSILDSGIRIKVREEDAAKATELLKQSGELKDEPEDTYFQTALPTWTILKYINTHKHGYVILICSIILILICLSLCYIHCKTL